MIETRKPFAQANAGGIGPSGQNRATPLKNRQAKTVTSVMQVNGAYNQDSLHQHLALKYSNLNP